MARPVKVFISSRFEEFREVRLALRSLLEHEPNLSLVMLDDDRAHALDAESRSLQELQESDLVVFVLGSTYSDQPDGGTSLTEREFDHAVEKNSAGLALDFRVWSLGRDESWDARALAFLEKAHRERVVGTLPGSTAIEHATVLADNIRTVVTEIQTAREMDIGSNFLQTTEETLRSMSLSLKVDPTVTASELNDYRRGFIHQRDNIVETITNTPDLTWMEEQLDEVRRGIPDDLLTRLLMILICQHRDRPRDRLRAADLAENLTSLVQRPVPDRALSADRAEQREVELVALRARVERMAVEVGFRPQIDTRIEELTELFGSHPMAQRSRSILTELVLWNNLRRQLLPEGSREAADATRQVAKALRDLFVIYPDFAASLAVSSGLPSRATSSVVNDVCRDLPDSFRNTDELLPRLLRRIRKHADDKSRSLSELFLEEVKLRTEIAETKSRYETEVSRCEVESSEARRAFEADSNMHRSAMVDRHRNEANELLSVVRDDLEGDVRHASVDMSDPDELDRFCAALSEMSEQYRRTAGAEIGPPPAPPVGSVDGRSDALREQIMTAEHLLSAHRGVRDRCAERRRSIAALRTNRFLAAGLAALTGFLILAVCLGAWWNLHGAQWVRELLDSFGESSVRSDFWSLVSEGVPNVAESLGEVIVVWVMVIGFSLVGSRISGAMGGVVGFLSGVVVSSVFQEGMMRVSIWVGYVGVAVLLLAVAALIGVVVCLPVVGVVDSRRRQSLDAAEIAVQGADQSLVELKAQLERILQSERDSAAAIQHYEDTRRSFAQRREQLRRLSTLIDQEVVPSLRDMSARHRREREDFEHSVTERSKELLQIAERRRDALLDERVEALRPLNARSAVLVPELKEQVRLYNRSFRAFPAVYNREYVPSERAAVGDLTRGAPGEVVVGTEKVVGRVVAWSASFIPVPITRETMEHIQSMSLQDDALRLARELQ